MDCDAVEIQMFTINDDLELLRKCKKPVHNIHIPIKDKHFKTRCENLSTLIESDDLSWLDNICKYASEFNAGIVMHNELDFNEIILIPPLHFKRLLDIVKKYPNVIFHVENTTMYAYKECASDSTPKMPYVCYYLNSLAGRSAFYPLLDTCHLSVLINSGLNVRYNYHDIIYEYSKNNPYFDIHLANSIGDGIGCRHGVGFDINKNLLKNILNYLKEFNIDQPNLILEVSEDNYIKAENCQKLHGQINEIIKKTS